MMDVVAFEASPAFLHSVAVHLLVCVIMWLLVLAAIGTDLWDRVYTQKKLHKPLVSHRIRLTIDKVGEYWRFLVIAFIIDAVIFIACTLLNVRSLPVVSMLFAVVEIVIEVKSLVEHARERKSQVADIDQLVRTIVTAASDHDAKQAIKQVAEYIVEDKNKETIKE